ncbi:hypothetical protein NDU88_000886 [Pleurodeles waltl]|uniref:Uncharacterized protein n=1 Tax=Pleurodeles waltl TaxID=8319 RepID=A0AAV7SXZ7_PLEWA|nr:hypothetical protein NDU88_000886 [Pleurodeles waltl]
MDGIPVVRPAYWEWRRCPVIAVTRHWAWRRCAWLRTLPYYTMEVQCKRGSYMSVKQRLCDLQIKYALLFQATFKVMDQEKTHIFQSPEDVWTWLHAKGLAATLGEEKEMDTWVTPKPRRRHRTPPNSRPDQTQAVAEWA